MRMDLKMLIAVVKNANQNQNISGKNLQSKCQKEEQTRKARVGHQKSVEDNRSALDNPMSEILEKNLQIRNILKEA